MVLDNPIGRDFGEPNDPEDTEVEPTPQQNGENGTADRLAKVLKQYGLSEDELEQILSGTKRLDKILDKYRLTEQELGVVIQSARGNKPISVPQLDISDQHIKYGFFADTHIGQKMFHEDLFDKMVRLFKKERVDFIVDAGDHLEGMSHRPGHVYELSEIGYESQMAKAVELYKQLPVRTYGIDGNHDAWYFRPQNMGVIVGEDLERRVDNYTNLGQMEGDLQLENGLWIKLFHANDGTAYADSYKIQKFIESLTGGEKPNIVHSGHYHKYLALWRRNIWGCESGTLCGQTEWMRGKKIPAHIGFGTVDVYVAPEGGIDRLRTMWVPYYEK